MEVIGVKVIGFLNSLGLLRSQKPMDTKVLAKAMLKSVKVLGNGKHNIEGQNILDLIKTNS